MLAGHDTTSTTLTYALWSLGHHRDIQDRVRAEVAALGERALTPDDVPELRHTVRVLHEALRLCPPGAGTAALAHPRHRGGRLPGRGRNHCRGQLLLRCTVIPRCGTIRCVSIRTGFSRNGRRVAAAGSTCRSAADHAHVSAITSRCWRPRSRWPPSSAAAEIESLDEDFPLETPFTVVAAAPIRARVLAVRAPAMTLRGTPQL